MLFSDLVGSTVLGESFDAEVVDEVVTTVQLAFKAEVEKLGGHVVKLLGDELMAIFGAPIAREDDAAAIHPGGAGDEQGAGAGQPEAPSGDT